MADFTPGPVPQEAIDFLAAKKLKVGFDYRDVWRHEHAGQFTIAKMSELDMLSDTRDSLVESLRAGKTFRQWSKQITPELQKRGWWGVAEATDPLTGKTGQVQLGSPRRLHTIYDANIRTARAAGQWERIQRTVTTHPYLLYQLGPSLRHRPQHVAWCGTLLPVDDPFWGWAMPPNGYGCKCWVRQVSHAEYGRLRDRGYQDPLSPQIIDPKTGLPTGHRQTRLLPVSTDAPEITWRKYVNKRTGEIERVPDGIDPGWDTNPGMEARRQTMARAFMQSVNRAPAAAGAAAAAQVLPGIHTALDHEYRAWVRNIENGVVHEAGGRRTIGALTPAIVDALRRKANVTPATAGLTIEQAEATAMFAGAGKDGAIDRADIYDLRAHLAAPAAVIMDASGATPTLLYVFDPSLPATAARGKMAVRIELGLGPYAVNAIRRCRPLSTDMLSGPRMLRLDDGQPL